MRYLKIKSSSGFRIQFTILEVNVLEFQMSITDLLLQYETDFQAINNEFESMKYTAAIDVINDENLKLPSETTHKDDLNALNISQLNDKLNISDDALAQLSGLWIIRGLFQEISISLNPVDEPDYRCDKYELQSIVDNLVKLKRKLSQFDESLIILDGLNKSYQDLISNTGKQLQYNFHIYFPTNDSFVSNVLTNDISMSYEEFMKISNLFETADTSFNIKSLHRKLQLQWDKILDHLINQDKIIKLDHQDDQYVLKVLNKRAGFQEYCESITEFMSFVNQFNIQSFKNFFLSKISNNLTNKVSENINNLINPTNEDLIQNLFRVVKLSKESHWNLSVEKSLSSGADLNNKLNDLYLDWVVDKYINRLRDLFSNEFVQLTESLHDEYYSLEAAQKQVSKKAEDVKNNSNNLKDENKDEWNEWDNDGWDDEEIPEIDSQSDNRSQAENDWNEDGWDDDAWDDGESNSNKKKESKEVHKVSQMPSILKNIVLEYKSESRKNDIQPLISALESFSIISYPPLNESFLLYNDLQTLNNYFMNEQLAKFLDINLKQCIQSLSNEVILILVSINLKHDDFISDSTNFDDFKLDNENESKLKLIDNWFNKMNKSKLKSTNNQNYKRIILDVISIILNWIINSIISMDEITEYQSTKLTTIIKSVQHIINTNLVLVDESNTTVAAYNKLNNVLFLINNHLKDIMEMFYQGEFFDLTTDELISIIESVFIKSDLRDNYIDEILDIRNVEA